MSEWFKEHAWKACNGATRSEVRILSLPPCQKLNIKRAPSGSSFYIYSGKARVRILLFRVVGKKK